MVSESVHEKLSRVQRPHVDLRFKLDEGSTQDFVLPFVIGVIGDFTADAIDDLPPFRDRKFIKINRDNFDAVLKSFQPEINLAVDHFLGDDPDESLCVSLRFQSFDDFRPMGIIQQVPELVAVMQERTAAQQSSNSQQQLDQLMNLDTKLSRQLSAILHHEKFRRLEGSWRGLHYLVFHMEEATDLQIHVICATKRELQQDFSKAAEWDRSIFYKRICEERFGSHGGHAFSAVVGDFEFDNDSDDISLLGKIAQVSAAAYCPFLTAPALSVLGVEGGFELPSERELQTRFQSPLFARWTALRGTEESRFLALVMPRILAREPYGATGQPCDEFDFQESNIDWLLKPAYRQNLCWSNPAYYLANRVMAAYAQTGYCTSFIGQGTGGTLEDIPFTFCLDADGQATSVSALEVTNLDDRIPPTLSNAGLIPVIYSKGEHLVALITADTLQRPKIYDRPEATAIAQARIWLPYILAAGRFVHYVKSIVRDGLTSAVDRQSLEQSLNQWLANFVCLDASPRDETKATLPLTDARIEFTDIPRRPHELELKIWLRPWTMMRDLPGPLCETLRIPRI